MAGRALVSSGGSGRGDWDWERVALSVPLLQVRRRVVPRPVLLFRVRAWDPCHGARAGARAAATEGLRLHNARDPPCACGARVGDSAQHVSLLRLLLHGHGLVSHLPAALVFRALGSGRAAAEQRRGSVGVGGRALVATGADHAVPGPVRHPGEIAAGALSMADLYGRLSIRE